MTGLGQLSHLGIAKETTWGTFVSPTDFLKFNSETLTLSIEELVSAQIRARREEPESYEGLGTIEGDTVHELHPHNIGYLLHALFSQETPSLVETGVYQHIYTLKQTPFSTVCFTQPYSLELHRDFTGQAFRFTGCALNALTLAFGVGQRISQATASWLCKDVTLDTESSPTLEQVPPFRWNQAEIKIDDTIYGLIEDVEVSFEQGLVGVPLLNSSNRIAQIDVGPFTGSLSLTFRPNDMDMWEDKFVAYTPIKLEVTFTGPSFGATSNYKLVLTMPEVLLTEYPVNVAGPGRITVAAAGKIKYNATAGYAIQVELVNSKDAY